MASTSGVAALASPFLGEADFEGQRIGASNPVTNGGQATYNGIISFTNVARDIVAKLLLNGFELAARSTPTTPRVHPVVLLFGDQTDGASLLAGDPNPNGIHYSEMIFAVPFVQRVGDSRWHTHIIRMYLDNDAAVAAGTLFGYQKMKAWLEWKGDDVRVYSQVSQTPLLEGTFKWGSEWHDGNEALDNIPNLQDMVSIMTTRILGHTNGKPICSHFEWNLDHAQVAQAEAYYSMKEPFREDMDEWPGLSPFLNATGGAVAVRGMQWRLSTQPDPFCW